MKRKISLFVILFMMISLITPVYGEDIFISGQYAIVMDKDSQHILYDKNIHERMNPASITKIVTCIVALEMVDDLDATTTITDSDIATVWATGASAANFYVGEVVTYRDIFMGAMLPSGADATRALANNTCGSQEAFVDKMNEFAASLGLSDTHFVNTTGIHDDNHYTTVYDMAIMTQYALNNDNFVEIFNRYQYTSSNGEHQWVKRVVYNARRSHIDTTMIEGCKSGYTSQANHTLASMLNLNDHRYICVVGNSQNGEGYSHCAINDTLTLGNYIASHYQYVQLLEEGTELKTIKVKDGVKKSISIKNPTAIWAVLPNDYNGDDIEWVYDLKDMSAPVKKDQELGELSITYQDQEIAHMTFLNEKAIKKEEKKITTSIIEWIYPYGVAAVLLIIFGFIVIKGKRH